MDEGILLRALEGLSTYDQGATDSGIHDERLRAECIAALQAMDENESRLFLSRCVREMFLTEDALALRYGIEDVVAFVEWLDDKMDCQL